MAENVVNATKIQLNTYGINIAAPGANAYTFQAGSTELCLLEQLCVSNNSGDTHYVDLYHQGTNVRYIARNFEIKAGVCQWFVTKENAFYLNDTGGGGRISLLYNTTNAGYSGGSAGDLHMIYSYSFIQD